MHDNPAIALLLNGLASPSLPGIDLSLERMHALLRALGNPEASLPPVIHLAGTNGKGSTQAFLRSIYAAAGYRVHAYTSPHLVRFNERIVVAGKEIDDEMLEALLAEVMRASHALPVTFFEATTAVALLAFSRVPADIVLLETGLGGRLDATNVVAAPALSIITPVAFDHMEFLGSQLSAIAAEKGGIIKPGTPCLLAPQRPEALQVLEKIAADRGAPCLSHGQHWQLSTAAEQPVVQLHAQRWALPAPGLPGRHQQQNAALASVAVQLLHDRLPVTPQSLAQGIENARWPARLQTLTFGPMVDAWGTRGKVLLDGAHNPAGAEILTEWLNGQQTKATLVLGMMKRKDLAAFLTPLAPAIRHLIAMPIPGEDSHTPEVIASAARAAGIPRASVAVTQTEANAMLAHEAPGILLLAGSLFFAGWLLKNHG